MMVVLNCFNNCTVCYSSQPKLRKDFFLFLFWSIQVHTGTLDLDHAGKLKTETQTQIRFLQLTS